MSDLRPAEDVAAEITGCEYQAPGRNATLYPAECAIHWDGWPCPAPTRVTALIEADRRAAMAKAWADGFTKAGRLLLGMDDGAWPPAPNPYEAVDHD